MKKVIKLIYIILCTLFFCNTSFAEAKDTSVNENNATQISSEDKKVLDDFIQILKDPNKVKAITNILETQDKLQTTKEEKSSSNIEVLSIDHIKSLDDDASSFVVFIYKKYKTLEIQKQVINYFYDLKSDIQNANYKYFLVLLLVTSAFSLVLLILEYFYSKIYGVDKYVQDFRNYKKSNNLIKAHILLFFTNIKYFLPILISPFLLAELIKINSYYINYGLIPDSIINILIFFITLQLLLKFLDLVFYKNQRKTLNSFKFWLSSLLYFLYIFVSLYYIFLILKNHALVKLNLVVFVLLLFVFFVKFRSLLKKISTKILKENLRDYKKFLIYAKNYSITLLYIVVYCYCVSILFLDPSITKSIIVKVLFVVMGILFIYLIQSYIASLFIKKLADRIEKRSKKISEVAFSKTETLVISFKGFWRFFKILYLIIFYFLYIKFLDVVFNTYYLDKIIDFISTGLINIVSNILISFCFLMILSFVFVLFIERYLYRLALCSDISTLRKGLTLYKILQKPYKILFIIILLISIISSMGISLPALLASTGILTLLVAFGMKDILQNFFNSIMFLLENSFALNDFIELDGKQGTVEEISMVYVKIRDSSGNLIMIPFKNIGNIVNYTKDYSYALVDVGVAYGSNIDKVFDTLQNIGKELQKDPEIKSFILSPIEIAGVVALADSSINIRCKIKTSPGKQFRVKSILYQRIYQHFMDRDIEIPFQQTVITVKKDSKDIFDEKI